MKSSKIAIDIQDLHEGLILDSMLESGGEVFRTSKHRKAILLGQAQFAALKKRFSLLVEDAGTGIGVIKD